MLRHQTIFQRCLNSGSLLTLLEYIFLQHRIFLANSAQRLSLTFLTSPVVVTTESSQLLEWTRRSSCRIFLVQSSLRVAGAMGSESAVCNFSNMRTTCKAQSSRRPVLDLSPTRSLREILWGSRKDAFFGNLDRKEFLQGSQRKGTFKGKLGPT